MAEAGLFAGRRVEFIRGEVIEMTPQDSRHATGVTLAADVLRALFGPGFTVRIQMPLALGLDSDPEPDVAVVTGSPRDYAGAHPTTAVLLVEVAESSLAYDRSEKAALYAQAGIDEYWILDLVDRQLEVYRAPREDPTAPYGYGYAGKNVLTGEESVVPLALPRVPLRVSELLP